MTERSNRLLRTIEKVNDFITERLEESMQFLTPFGILITVLCPILFILFYDTEELWLDGGMWVLSIILLLYKHTQWLNKKCLPVYWLGFLIITFPFNFSYGLLCQPDQTTYALGVMFMLMVIIIVVADIWMILLILLIGTYMALAAYSGSVIHLKLPGAIEKFLALYIVGVIFGVVLAYKKGNDRRNKLEAIYSLAGSISHEINTPLAIIKDNADQLNREIPHDKKPWRDSLELISQECILVRDIIRIILNNSQKFKDLKKHYRATPIYAIIDRTLTNYPYRYHDTFEKSQIVWHRQQDFDFYGMDLLMEHVILNLLKNAIRSLVHARKGQIIIWNEQDKKYNYLFFKDTGMGMTPRTKKKLFKSFFTTDSQGTGLGLYFCKNTIKSFGGNITCESELGQYTTFIIKLPKLQHK